MAWAQQHRQRYYYRNVRDGARVHRRYLGRGPEADLAAALVEQRRQDRLAQREWWRGEQAGWEAAERPCLALAAGTDMLVEAVLFANGYWRHNRGRWRRRRKPIMDAHQTRLPGPAGSLEALGQRARTGDLSILDELRAALDADP